MLKSLLAALLIPAIASLSAQTAAPTAIPVEKTRKSLLLANGAVPDTIAPETNFRLFLRYSSKENPVVKFDDFSVELPAGDNTSADLTFEHLPNSPALIHLRTSGDPTARRIEIPDSTFRTASSGAEILPGKDFPMDQAFTLMARFQTSSRNGTLASRAPARGKWAAGGKTLFLRGGSLHYDVGWEGEISGGPNLADGKEHLVALAVDQKGNVTLYVDGKRVANGEDLTSKDRKNHAFKIGTTNPDFGGNFDFEKGSIEQVLFWKRELSAKEIITTSEKKVSGLNTPDFHWKKPTESKSTPPALIKGILHPGYGTVVSLDFKGNTKIHEAWTQPLETSDHTDILSAWDDVAFKRGQQIYNQLCVTCHGTDKQEGSIPIALKFHEGAFKNGNDPFRMFQTLTKGYNMMMPMPQFTTRQKYDVIHFIREEYLRKHNPSQLSEVDGAYLASLPRGMSQIEEQESTNKVPPYKQMDFGNVLFWTYQIEPGPIDKNVNIAQKGIAIRLDPGPGGVSKGRAWAVYDHDTMRLAAIYTGDEFVDWKGIAFDGSHGTHTSIVGQRLLVNDDKPGWAQPETCSWDPIRVEGKDGRLFGPLPKDWVKFDGLLQDETGPVLRYTVGTTQVLDRFVYPDDGSSFQRVIQLAESKQQLKLRIRKHNGGPVPDHCVVEDGSICRVFPPSDKPRTISFFYGKNGEFRETKPTSFHTHGPRKQTPTVVTTQIQRGDESGPFAVDTLTVPVQNLNPLQSWMRTSGFDFYPDGKRAAVCTWMGDVWIVEGIDQLEGTLTWKRICSGLFQPLGLKIVNNKIHVTCRDQLAKLHDRNGDETIDFIECLNNDHQVTEHFHEFAMGLQTDEEGNFYYAKSARHAKDSLVPHHGTLLRVSPDGYKTDILATGFRAANGVCLNPDGTFIVTDQEGHWNPKNRINWVNGDGPTEFFGNVYGYSPVTDTSDEAMKNPLCWITNAFDRSPSELLWVPKDAKWGSLNGQLLNLSYGYGKIYVVPHETIDGERQGGLCELPLKQFPTGIMRGRFHPGDGQLYGCGMFAWAGTQRKAGGFYRIRKTDQPAHLPTKIEAKGKTVTLTLSDPVGSVSPADFKVKAWDLKRTRNYGSKHYNEREWKVTKAELSGDRITLTIPDLEPTWGMSIEMNLAGQNGEKERRLIHNSIFELPN